MHDPFPQKWTPSSGNGRVRSRAVPSRRGIAQNPRALVLPGPEDLQVTRVGPVGLEPTTRGLKVDPESAAQTLKVPVSSRNASQPLSSILVRLEPLADSLRTPTRVLGVTTTRQGTQDRQQTRSSLTPSELAA